MSRNKVIKVIWVKNPARLWIRLDCYVILRWSWTCKCNRLVIKLKSSIGESWRFPVRGMKGSKSECEADPFYHQDESATSSSYASPAHRLHSSQQHDRSEQPREPQPVELPEVRVVNVKEPTKSYDGSFYCIHTSIEIVVVISLVSALNTYHRRLTVLFSLFSNHSLA